MQSLFRSFTFNITTDMAGLKSTSFSICPISSSVSGISFHDFWINYCHDSPLLIYNLYLLKIFLVTLGLTIYIFIRLPSINIILLYCRNLTTVYLQFLPPICVLWCNIFLYICYKSTVICHYIALDSQLSWWQIKIKINISCVTLS